MCEQKLTETLKDFTRIAAGDHWRKKKQSNQLRGTRSRLLISRRLC